MTRPVPALEPAPGITVPGVGVPLPNEQEATDAAVNYGWLIALVIIGLIVKGLVTYVTRQINFKLLLGLIVVGVVAYQIGKGGS